MAFCRLRSNLLVGLQPVLQSYSDSSVKGLGTGLQSHVFGFPENTCDLCMFCCATYLPQRKHSQSIPVPGTSSDSRAFCNILFTACEAYSILKARDVQVTDWTGMTRTWIQLSGSLSLTGLSISSLHCKGAADVVLLHYRHLGSIPCGCRSAHGV